MEAQRTFSEWKGCPYGEWLRSGGCSIGEVYEMLAMDHLQVGLGALKGTPLQEIFNIPHHGGAIERTCETFYISNARDFLR